MSCVAEPNDKDKLVRCASSLFSRLSATDQCQILTDEIRQNLAEDILQTADGLPEEDFRLITFTEVFEKLAVDKQNKFLSNEMKKLKENDRFWELCFWFQQLEADDQRDLLKKLNPNMPGNVQIPGTSDDDTKFRIKQLAAVTAEIPLSAKDLLGILSVSQRSFIRQQNFASAAQLLSCLSTLGFSLLSPYDRKRVTKIGLPVDVKGEEEDDSTIKSFMKIKDDASYDISSRVFLCTIISETFFDERTREFIFYFRQLGTKHQEEIIDRLSNRLESHKLPDKVASHAIIEKFSEESEEDFRDRRFINLCVGYPFIWINDTMDELNGAGKWDLRDLHETSRYAKFLKEFSNIWAKARCPHDSRNLIQLIIDAIVHDDRKKVFPQDDDRKADMEKLIPQGDDIEKLPNESMEDFRVRRFTESFNRLQISSQMHIVEFIQQTVFQDVGIAFRKLTGGGPYTGDSSSLKNDLIKFTPPNLRDEPGPPTSQGSSGGERTNREDWK